MARIIIESNYGHWSAWFQDHPETVFGGDSPDVAAARLLKRYGIKADSIQAIGDPTMDRFELLIPSDQ